MYAIYVKFCSQSLNKMYDLYKIIPVGKLLFLTLFGRHVLNAIKIDKDNMR